LGANCNGKNTPDKNIIGKRMRFPTMDTVSSLSETIPARAPNAMNMRLPEIMIISIMMILMGL
jgi:hypothetical protein